MANRSPLGPRRLLDLLLLFIVLLLSPAPRVVVASWDVRPVL
jgi:hypothetical protein